MTQHNILPIEQWATEERDGSLKLHDPYGDDTFSQDLPPSWMTKDRDLDKGLEHLAVTLPDHGYMFGVWYAQNDVTAADLGRRPTPADFDTMDEYAEPQFEALVLGSNAVWYAKDGIDRPAEDERVEEAIRGEFEPFPTKDGFLNRIGLAVATARIPHGVVGVDEHGAMVPGAPEPGYAMGKLHTMFGTYAMARLVYGPDHDIITAAEIQLDHTAQWMRALAIGRLSGNLLLQQKRESEGEYVPSSLIVLPGRQVDTARKLRSSGVPRVIDELAPDVTFDDRTQISTIVMKEGEITADVRRGEIEAEPR